MLMQWVFGTEAPDEMRSHHHPEVPQTLVPVSSQVSHIAGACERRRHSIASLFSTSKTEDSTAQQPLHVPICPSWEPCRKSGMWMGKEGGTMIVVLLCKHPFAFQYKNPWQRRAGTHPSALPVGHSPEPAPCTAAQPLHHMLHLGQVPLWTTNTF